MSSTDENRRREIGRRIKQRYQELGWNVEKVARLAGYDEKTVRHVINGNAARPATVIAILQALGLEASDAGALTESANEHGGYTKRFFDKYAGRYAAYRWSHDEARFVFRTIFTLAWSPARACGVFRENQRYKNAMGKLIDNSQDGEVYASDGVSVLHLLTAKDGLLRLITLTKLQEEADTVMRGGVLTQSRRTFAQPVVSPVVLDKLDADMTDEAVARLVGEVTPSDPDYAYIVAALDRTEREVVLSAFRTGSGDLRPPDGPPAA